MSICVTQPTIESPPAHRYSSPARSTGSQSAARARSRSIRTPVAGRSRSREPWVFRSAQTATPALHVRSTLGQLKSARPRPPTISVNCPDGSQRSETLSSLVAGLTQPAFGIDAQGNALKGFPVRGLSLSASVSIGGNAYDARGVPDVNAIMTASASSFSLTNAPVQFMVDCGQHTAPVDLTFDIVSTGTALDGPPTITIDIPSEVTCPSTVSLDSTTSDPDNDVDRVRWYIDDKLMAPSTTSITMTDDHVFRAVVFDSRGAATTAESSVTCR